MRITASRLRQDIYRILDSVIETGVPIEIERQGRILRIVPPGESSRTAALTRREYLNTEPEDLVHLDWSAEWRE